MELEFEGLVLPETCPACDAYLDSEKRFFEVNGKSPQLTAEYVCGTIITQMFLDRETGERHTNVSAGCRIAPLKRLTNE